jgi:uncharacterized protein
MIADSEHKPVPVESSSAETFIDAAPGSAEPDVAEGERLPQHGLARSIALHLIPGAVTAAIYIASVPAVTRSGYPPLAALLIASVVGLIPIELGVLLFEGKRKNGCLSLDGILLYREKWPTSRYFTVVPVLVLICIVVYGISLPIDHLWARAAFSWLPPWYVFTSVKQYAGFGRPALMVTFGIRIVVFLAISVVQEMYFRAYLLPRISRFGVRGVLLNCGLYAIYHFWLPNSMPGLFLASLPIALATWMSKNYRVGMATQVVLGFLGSLLGLLAVIHHSR